MGTEIPCPFCRRRFGTQAGLTLHVRNGHTGMEAQDYLDQRQKDRQAKMKQWHQEHQ